MTATACAEKTVCSITQARQKVQTPEFPLRHALQVAGIKILDPEKVAEFKKRYKAEHCRHRAEAEVAFKNWPNCILSGILLLVLGLAIGALIAGFLANGAMRILVVLAFGSSSLGIGLLWATRLRRVAVADRAGELMNMTWWNYTFLEEWGTACVPPRVREIAEEIQTRSPEVRIEVESFYKDPLLWVWLHNERCCVAHWYIPDDHLAAKLAAELFA